jgi:Cu-Zn family superoxide dismutase
VRRDHQILTLTLTTRLRAGARRTAAWHTATGRSGRLRPVSVSVALLLGATLLAACDSMPRIVPEAGTMGVARLDPRNSSTVRGIISFTQRGSGVWISANFTDLVPGSHSLYIHEVGNCSSANAASAGPVWSAEGAAAGGKRTGDLPQLYAGTEGNAVLQITTADLSVGTGAPNDVIGHSVVVYARLDPDPKAEFGVRNDRLACGVIERSLGVDLKNLL